MKNITGISNSLNLQLDNKAILFLRGHSPDFTELVKQKIWVRQLKIEVCQAESNHSIVYCFAESDADKFGILKDNQLIFRIPNKHIKPYKPKKQCEQ